MVTDADTHLSIEQTARRGAEVVNGLLAAHRRRADGVDDGVDTAKHRLQTIAGNQVYAERSADPDRLVSGLLEMGNGAGSDVAGRPGYSDAHGEAPSTTLDSAVATVAPRRPVIRRHHGKRHALGGRSGQ